MRLSALTFDAGGTLIYPSRPVGEIYAGVAFQMGVTLDPAALDQSFKKSFKSVAPLMINGHPLTSSSKDWWRNLVREVLISSGQFSLMSEEAEFERYFLSVYEEFLKAEHWTVCSELINILGFCRGHGIKTAVLSNWDQRLVPILDILDLSRYFDHIIVSCEVGVEKPDPAIFEFASCSLGESRENILHIGDSQREDYEGALNAGMRAFLIDPQRRNIGDILKILGL